MKPRLLVLFAASLFLTALAHAFGFDHQETFSRSGVFSPTGKITLHNVNGDIVVQTWDRNEILIEGEKSAKTEEELKLIELTIDLSDSRAEIRARLPKRPGSWGDRHVRGAVTFKLTVPATAILEEIQTVNSSVKIDGVRGAVTVHTVNGQIRATHLGGDTRLNTVNGQLHASFAALAPDQKLSLKTVNGSVHVALPTDAGVSVTGSVVNGTINCDFPIQVSGKIGGKRIKGTIGDGRASLHADSVNGSIHLDRI